MAERIVSKSLAGLEDLLLGNGTEQQIRNGYEYPITKLSLPWACSDIAELLELDTTKFTQALVSGIAYKHNGSAWVKVSDNTLREDLAELGGGNIAGWYDAPSSVRAYNSKTLSNTWQDAVAAARLVSGPDTPVVIGANASGVEAVAVQYALPSGVTGYHLSQGTTAAASTDKRPLILLEKVCDSGTTFGPHSMANFSMKYVGGTNGAIPLSTYVEATGSSAGGAIGIQTRARILSPTASGWGGWSYVDVAGNLPVRAIGHEINVRCNIPQPLIWSASGGVVDGLVIATVDNGSNNMANSAIKISRSSQGQGFLTGIRIGYKTILPSDTTDLSVLNGEAFLINGGSIAAEQYGGIRLGANDGAGFTKFHYGLRMNEAQFNNNVAVWLGDNQRIRWGDALNSGPYLTCTGSEHQVVGAPLNITNGVASALRTNGSKVVGTRVTGFARMTGTPLKTSFNADTATLTQVAQRLKAIEDALHADSGHGLYGLT